MKKYLVALCMIPTMSFSDESVNNGIESVNISITHIGLNFSKLDDSPNAKYIRAGISGSLFYRIGGSGKIFTGLSIGGLRGESDNFKQTEKNIEIFAGYRKIYSSQLDMFIDYEVGLGYSKRKYESFQFTGFTDDTKSKTLSTSIYLGKSIVLNSNHAIEGKFGVVVNYLNSSDGWQTNVFAPTGSLSWSYRLE